jgi:hypothetical protein
MPCCLDDECQSGQCFGEGSNRKCGVATMRAPEGGDCGDMSDCDVEVACDIENHECVTTVPITLGGGSCTVVGSSNPGVCAVGDAGACGLPGVIRTQGGLPCCYERSGQKVSCLDAGTCYEDPPGSGRLGSFAGGVCPL